MALFNRYQIETPESVELEFTLAGIGNRLYGVLVDYLCLGLIITLLLISWAVLAYNILLYGDEKWQLWLTAVQIFLIFSVYVGYFVFFETLWQGQTPGKRRAKIRVIRGDGKPVGLQEATLRAIFRPLDDFLYIGALLIIFTRREQRIGDILAGTLVIRESRSGQKGSLQLEEPEAARLLAEQIRAKPQWQSITAEDWLIISDYLRQRPELLPKARSATAERLAQQVRARLKFSEPGTEASSQATVLLEAIYLAGQERRDFAF